MSEWVAIRYLTRQTTDAYQEAVQEMLRRCGVTEECDFSKCGCHLLEIRTCGSFGTAWQNTLASGERPIDGVKLEVGGKVLGCTAWVPCETHWRYAVDCKAGLAQEPDRWGRRKPYEVKR